MKVVLADIEEPALDAAVRELRRREYDVIGVRTDTSSAESVQALARTTLDAYGRVHLVCNNAGVEGYLEGPIWEATSNDWRWTFGVNFWGVVHGVQTFVPIMLDQGEQAHIVNTASAVGLVTATNMYGITKHAVVALSEVLYGQLRQRNAPVGVSVLCPGVVATRIFEGWRNRPAALRDADPQREAAGRETRAAMMERNRRGMAPDSVAAIVLQAIKDERFYILTDHDWDERIRARVAAVLERGNPGQSAVGSGQ
jgi:NAD(P)-dependent dehydrogenase (short-subunit alcohol dehydrogenase family)